MRSRELEDAQIENHAQPTGNQFNEWPSPGRSFGPRRSRAANLIARQGLYCRCRLFGCGDCRALHGKEPEADLRTTETTFPGDVPLTTDVWFARRLGEYQGLAALRGNSFAAVFTIAAAQAENGPTDIFFARIGPGGGDETD
jgi:hypothetical protein